jgi:hypothetical protein
VDEIIFRKSLQELIKKRPEQAEDVQKIISQVYKELDSILEENEDEEDEKEENLDTCEISKSQ